MISCCLLWNIPEGSGVRPACGYPSQPDHQEKETVFTLLHAREEAGMSLTETWMMQPVSSVCALVFSHPESTYFSVGVTRGRPAGGLRLQKAGLPALTSPFPLMQHTDQIQALSEFLLEYATTLMGAGVHTNRAVRNISRIAAAYGYSADMTIFQRNITMSLICKDDETLRRTSVRKLKPLAFNLNLIQQLSELSWLPVDNNVSIAEMEQAFRSMVRTKRFSRWTDLLLVSVGNAAFCRLFNGDLWAMLTVFAATMLGFLAKQQLTPAEIQSAGGHHPFRLHRFHGGRVRRPFPDRLHTADRPGNQRPVPGARRPDDQLHYGPDARPHPDGHFPRRPLYHDDRLHRHRPFRNHAHRRGKQLMNPDFISSILLDGLMAAIAATGFAVISNPPKRAIAVSAVLAAVGHAFRFYMQHSWTIDISSATFIAAFTIGMLGSHDGQAGKMPGGNIRFPFPASHDSRACTPIRPS